MSDKNISLLLIVVALLLAGTFVSCSQNKQTLVQQNQTTPTDSAARDSLKLILSSYPVVTIIANLPDSSQPKQIDITKPPPTITIKIPPETITGVVPAGNFKTYTTDDGLALDAISCSLMDKKGNLWFGTAGGGVSKYDGKSFTNFTTAQGLVNSAVISIAEDKTGNLWFGTSGGGVSRYDGKSFTSFTTAQGLANNGVYSICEDKTGNLWFGTAGGGVSRYDGKSFVNFTTAQGLANNVVLCITEDKAGNLWFGTGGGGSRYDPVSSNGAGSKPFVNFTTAQGLADNGVFSICEDKTGNLWFGTAGGGVSRYDGKSFVNFTTAQGLVNNIVVSITEDKTGNLWFGTAGGGVSRYGPASGAGQAQSFTNFTTAQGLANNGVRSITEDKTGNLWFGTDGGGVSRYDGKSFTSFTTAQGLANNGVYSICEDKTGNLWFGTGGSGVSRYDGKSFTSFTTAQGLANNRVLSICEDKTGNLWFGTGGGGVSRYDGKSFTSFTRAQGLANRVFSITEDKTGNLWFGTSGGGVRRYDGKSFMSFTTAQGLANNVVLSICEDKTGNLWFGTYGGGASRYDGKSFMSFTTAQGLANNVVYSICEDKTGNLWFGTDGGGVSRYDGKSFTSFTTENGLPDNKVTQVVIDAQENIVIGTNFGIAVLTGWKDKGGKKIAPQNSLTNEELKNYVPVFEIYNSAMGYPVKDVNGGQGTMYKDSKGILWIATGSDKTALVRFDYAALHKNINPPNVFIESVKINEEKINWYNLKLKVESQKSKEEKGKKKDSLDLRGFGSNDSSIAAQQEMMTYGKLLSEEERRALQKKYAGIKFSGISKWYPVPQNLVLPSNHNNITFDFGARELSRPSLVKYQYILEGYNNYWSPPSNKTTASFGNIYEGTYTFKLKAMSPEGIWSEPITYKFKVSPPWYRTWWFYVAQISGVLLLVAIALLLGGSEKGIATKVAGYLSTMLIFIVFEFFQNIAEMGFEYYVGSAILVIKILISAGFALTLQPVETLIKKLVHRRVLVRRTKKIKKSKDDEKI